MSLHMYMKCVNHHFHEINVAGTTNLDSFTITRADFDRMALLVKEQYQRAHPGCSPDEHFAKSAVVNFAGRNLAVYLKREQDALPENPAPQVIVIDVRDLFGMVFNRQTS